MAPQLRKLTTEEIDDILDIIQIDPLVPFDISMAICENVRDRIRPQLQSVNIYPENIPKLKQEVERQYYISRAQPGDMVGCLAASSIGEQNTQQTLNSFHSAGIMKANLTTGVVRLKELLNATQNLKHPSNTIHLRDNDTDLYTVKRIAESNFKYYDINSCIVKYDIVYNRQLTSYEKKYYNFFNTYYNKHKHGVWSVRLYFDSNVLFRIQKSLEHISNCILSNFKDLYCVFFPDNKSIIDLWFDEDISDPENIIQINKSDKKIDIEIVKNEDEKKVDVVNFLDIDDELNTTIIDDENENIDEDIIANPTSSEVYNNSLITNDNKMYFYLKNVVVPTIINIKVSGVDKIEECYYTEGKGGKWYIDTKGSNFKELLQHPLVDHTKLYTLDMWEIYEVLGIGATRDFLKNEFDKIIKVSNRHLDILVSSMVNSGKILSVSRYGMNKNQSSIFAKVAFEQPFDHFFNAATTGEKDTIDGVSASIMVGKIGRMGTGMIDVLFDTKKLLNINKLEKVEEESIKEDSIKEEDKTEELYSNNQEDEDIDIM
jgi:DNA-directed RNA polymerase II subunit RPB1